MTKRTIFLWIAIISGVSCLGQTTQLDSIFNQGHYRSYQVHLPPAYDGATDLPLLMALHGGQSDGPSLMASSDFDEIGDTANYISLFPTAYKGQWADGRGTTQAELDGIDDVAFLGQLLDTLISKYAIDTCRLYVTGLSSGGMMTQRLACDNSGLFTAHASIMSSLPSVYYPQCQPSQMVNMLMMNGTEDNFSPYAGGPSSVPSSTGTVTGVDSTINLWANLAACSNMSSPDSTVYPDINTNDNGYVVKFDFGPCTSPYEVVLYKVYGGGHTLPGGPGPVFVPIVGYSNKDINGAEHIWNFFSDKSKCSLATSVRQAARSEGLSIFPNPVRDILSLRGAESGRDLRVFNSWGKVVWQGKASTIEVRDWPSGIYFLGLEGEENVEWVKFIKL